MTDTELRTRRPVPPPDLDAEEEVDLGRYWQRVSARWWLPLLGLVAGIALGYLLAQGSSKVYRAEALLYLGQPFSLNANAPVQSLATNPSTVNRMVRSEAALREAAARSGERVGKLRGKVSTKSVQAARGAVRAGQNPLVEVAVKGDSARATAMAANTLAQHVVNRLSPLVDDKVEALERRLDGQNDALASIERRTNLLETAVRRGEGTTLIERLFLVSQLDNAEQRRAQLLDEQADTQQLLSLAENVERPQIVEEAVARETTARSVRSSVLVGAALGLILGALAALLWEPVLARTGRRPTA
jgi:hypothetical protein